MTYNNFAVFYNLAPNSFYWFAVDDNAFPVNQVVLPSTVTWAVTPSTRTPIFSAVGAHYIILPWDPNGNPETIYNYTQYSVLTSTDPDPQTDASGAVVTTSATYNMVLSTSGLNANTTYYFQIAAVNHADIITGYTTTVATSTLADMPTDSTFTMVALSSLTFSWSSDNSPGTLFTVLVATVPNPSSFPAGAVVTTSATYNTFLSSTGLTAETTYYFQVAATNNNGIMTDYTTPASTATLANAPNILGFTMVGSSSITFAWSTANPIPDAPYTVLVATVPNPSSFPAGAVVTTSVTYNTFLSSAGLNANTSYYFQVAATNMSGIITDFTASVTTMTLSLAPANSSFTMVGLSSITFAWSALDGIAVQYSVLTSTVPNPSSFPTGAVVTASATYNTFLSSSGLNADTTYYFQVAAIQNGSPNYAAVIGTATLAYPPATAATAFTAVYISSMSVAWSADSNAVGVTTYTVVLTTSPVFPNALSGNVILSTAQAGSSLSATVTGLGAGATYYLFVDARNWDNASSGYVFMGSTMTPASFWSQICSAGGLMSLNTVGGDIIVVFPANAFTTCVQVTLGVATNGCPAPASNATTLTPIGVCALLTIPDSALPTQPIFASVGFRSGDLTSNIDARQLVLAYYAAPQNTWAPMTPASGQGSNPVAAQWPTTLPMSQISYFQLMASIPATSLSNAKVYPNPFRPALGHSLITFSQLPTSSRIRIYTVLGELVKDLDTDATGMAHWDVTNQSGRPVASGAYFALVQGSGQKTILKVLIQR